ncbi:DUF4185 domain-containing protein [Knoellia subterranea]|uniref:DUF4185 domain-containing protein n=1 Tax=Knoellia subterranea KCTC 19937 TaxID=1385521 RepID=A0A0A0JP62_9MICO|nr:DUF4185 domain-containing protein [Knoellia subterranea]KGN37847.1 hypothetical protein N803_12365 [Knoellia subterranea KCTC 19937]
MTSRRYAVFAAALATSLALGACSTLPGLGGEGTGEGEGAAYAMSVDCPAAPTEGHLKPTVAQLNSILAEADLPYWQAADIGASARLDDGRLVWVFGDTIRRSGIGPSMVANSMLITSGLCLSQLMAPSRGPIIPDVEPGTVRWPMSVSVVEEGGTERIVVFTARIRRGSGNDVWGFRYLGSDAVTFTVAEGEAPQLEQILELTPDRDDAYQVNWGSASMVSGDHIYVYGTELPRATAFGRSLRVGRAALATAQDRGTWEFWDGERWQADELRATAIIPSQGGVSQTLSVHEIDGKVVAVSKKDGDLGSTVATWASTEPVGPWKVSAALDAPFLTGKDEFAYAPLAHPEVALASGKLLVSISRNTTDLARLKQNPVIGRPRFAEIARP